MQIFIVMPSLFSGLANRALSTMRRHGADGVDLRFVVVSSTTPDGDDVEFVYEEQPRGIYPAIRAGFDRCPDGSIVMVTCDDVVHAPGWLAKTLPAFLEIERTTQNKKLIVGLRHAGGIGTCYGHMYANFPMFRKNVVTDDPFIEENFMPSYLRSQWGDVALGLAVWAAGGVVKDAGTEAVLGWADRMEQPEALHKHSSAESDMIAVQEKFGPYFGHTWPQTFRGFNIDCPPSMLVDATIRVPSFHHFTLAYSEHQLNLGRRFG